MIYWKKLKITVALFLCITFLITTSPTTFAATDQQTDEVRAYLEQYHYNKPSAASLSGSSIEDMIKSLNDPYTEFFEAEEWEAYSNALDQTFVGIGIVIGETNGNVFVEQLIEGGPAQLAGLMVGDQLVSSDGKSLINTTTLQVQSLLLGKEGTSLLLKVKRDGKLLDFSITRKKLQIPAVSTTMLGDGVGYLELSGFTFNAGKEMKEKLIKLEEEGLTSLIIDLRNNGGGYVSSAMAIASLFIEDGVLAHLRDRDNEDYPLKVTGSKKKYPVAVLINGYSASASELLAGALQDYGLATLVGTRSYGKGVVQTIVNLESGGVLKFTIEQYFTPSGRKVDKVGLIPNIVNTDVSGQLIDAFRAVNGNKVTINIQDRLVNVNGILNYDNTAAGQNKKGIWHANLRLIATLIGAQLKVDTKSKTFTLTKGELTYTIPTNDSHLIVKNGRTLIDVRLIKKWFPSFSYLVKENTLKLTASK
ncbi:MAG: S41 family peptidase [Candidatus Cohnella colombiensis]|uniref:S41 family peptidase n=1 Tax=Candidatus Cohnella colombiensis TaxID=3121368 RepID=A0AA95EYD9_9BACL|nr:MAG: S41 family peptidase [Cohnella sp.]